MGNKKDRNHRKKEMKHSVESLVQKNAFDLLSWSKQAIISTNATSPSKSTLSVPLKLAANSASSKRNKTKISCGKTSPVPTASSASSTATSAPPTKSPAPAHKIRKKPLTKTSDNFRPPEPLKCSSNLPIKKDEAEINSNGSCGVAVPNQSPSPNDIWSSDDDEDIVMFLSTPETDSNSKNTCLDESLSDDENEAARDLQLFYYLMSPEIDSNSKNTCQDVDVSDDENEAAINIQILNYLKSPEIDIRPVSSSDSELAADDTADESDDSEFSIDDPLGSEFAGDDPLGSEFAGDEPLDSEFAGDDSVDSEFAGDDPLDSEFAGDEPLDSELAGDDPVDSEFAGDEPLDSELAGDDPLDSEFAGDDTDDPSLYLEFTDVPLYLEFTDYPWGSEFIDDPLDSEFVDDLLGSEFTDDLLDSKSAIDSVDSKSAVDSVDSKSAVDSVDLEFEVPADDSQDSKFAVDDSSDSKSAVDSVDLEFEVPVDGSKDLKFPVDSEVAVDNDVGGSLSSIGAADAKSFTLESYISSHLPFTKDNKKQWIANISSLDEIDSALVVLKKILPAETKVDIFPAPPAPAIKNDDQKLTPTEPEINEPQNVDGIEKIMSGQVSQNSDSILCNILHKMPVIITNPEGRNTNTKYVNPPKCDEQGRVDPLMNVVCVYDDCLTPDEDNSIQSSMRMSYLKRTLRNYLSYCDILGR